MRLSNLLLLVGASGALFAGDLSHRFDLTLRRILRGSPPYYNEAFVLADAVPRHTRRFTNFSGDLSGRYIGALALAAGQSDRRLPTLGRVAAKLLGFQRPDGHFGDSMSASGVVDNDMALLWGNGRLLTGLLEYYALQPKPEVLDVCRRLGDFLVKVAPVFNSEAVRRQYSGEKYAVGYICWTQNVEPLAALYRVTRDPRYLELARELAARTVRRPAQHSHGFLTTVRGILELYRVTGDKKYLEQAETESRGVIASGNVLVQGAVPELFAPRIQRDEGCSEADWLRLGLELWKETRNQEYLEQAELTLFNEFAFNQFSSGDFGHHQFTETGTGTEYARAWWCCTLHGLRAFSTIFEHVFHAGDGRLAYDLPVDGRGEAPGLAVRATSTLERDARVRLEIVKAATQPRTLGVRQPRWASAVRLLLNGRAIAPRPRAGYLEVTRPWKAQDALTVTYTLRTRLVQRKDKPGRVAVFHGPWLLAVDPQASPSYFDEPSSENRVGLPGDPDDLTLDPAPPGAARPFTVPAARFTLHYLPGGYPMQPGAALLRPIAEHTAESDGNPLEFWLPVESPPKEPRLQ